MILGPGIGDWTQELASRCLHGSKLPRLALDGPFSAPTQSALDKRVLIAVGAGVGVTPFISLLSTLVSELLSSKKHGLVEAHFYWISRDPTEFIFAWNMLRKWLKHEILQSKIFIHLYSTAKGPTQNLPAFLFREAVKRQSLVDRQLFKKHLVEWLQQKEVQTPGPQFPWAWAEGGAEDLIWVKCQYLESEGVASAFKTIHSEVSNKSNSSLHLQNEECIEMIPVYFGRPNFKRDIASIGRVVYFFLVENCCCFKYGTVGMWCYSQ